MVTHCKLKFKSYNTYSLPIFLYGSECREFIHQGGCMENRRSRSKMPAEAARYQVVPVCFQCRCSVEDQLITFHLNCPVQAYLPLWVYSTYLLDDIIDTKNILFALSPEVWKKTARTSLYHMAQDCTERLEIPQPHTD